MAEDLKQTGLQPDYYQVEVPNKKEIIESEGPAQRLEQIMGDMSEARKRRDYALEDSLLKQLSDLFKEYTGQDLMEKAISAAKEEVEFEGGKTTPKKDLLSEDSFKKEVEAFKLRQQTLSAKKAWEKLSVDEKNLYSNDIAFFVAALEKKAEELKKSGYVISKEVFCNMTANGYSLLNTKKNFWGKIVLPVLIGDGAYRFEIMSSRDFTNMLAMMQDLSDLTATQAVADRFNKELLYGKRRWQRRKARKIKEIIASVTKTVKEEYLEESEKTKIKEQLGEKIKEKIIKEIELEERASLQRLAEIGEIGPLERLRDFEKLEEKTDRNIRQEIKKLEKGLTKDIEERNKEEKKITSLLKKQVKKGKILKKRKNYLNKVAPQEAKEESPPIIEQQPPAEDKKIPAL
jgi:phage FluMu protein gp41